MKLLILLIVLVLNQQQIAGWIGRLGYDPQEFAKHGVVDSHCFTTSQKLGRFNKGEVKRIPGQCAIAECLEDRDIKLSGCAPVGVHPPCHIGPGDLSKPFGECCYTVICPEDADVKNEID